MFSGYSATIRTSSPFSRLNSIAWGQEPSPPRRHRVRAPDAVKCFRLINELSDLLSSTHVHNLNQAYQTLWTSLGPVEPPFRFKTWKLALFN